MTIAGQPSFGFASGDVIIVTGAGSGIGRATARNAAAMGLSVAVWDLNLPGAEETVDLITEAGGKALAIAADVSDDDQVNAAMDATEALGDARYLVNNAGPASASSDLEFERAIQICVGSVRRVTETWLARGPREDAALVNIASVAGNIIGTLPDWYPASKAAIMGFTRYLAAYRSDEVRSNAVAPGMTDTPRLKGFTASEVGQRILQRIPMHRLATPEEMSWAVLFLLSPLSSYTNGHMLVVDGGWTVSQ